MIPTKDERMAVALCLIALGRVDCGRPLGGETARQIARDVLIEIGVDWNEVLRRADRMTRTGAAVRDDAVSSE